ESPAAAVELIIEPRDRDLGDGFSVRRLLPHGKRRAVGPFVFFDHFGPVRFAPGKGMDVRPHPHINLATVTYLFDGEMIHRDSVGSHQAIRPGDINWMTAGRGIVHSERTDPVRREAGSSAHGLQLWVALPREHEETAPEFHHHPATTLPTFTDDGVEVRILAGEAFGLKSPVRTFSRLIYLDVRMDAGATFDVPEDQVERGLYIVEGTIVCAGQTFAPTRLLSLHAGRPVQVRAQTATRLVLIGGDAFPEPRHIWWNFVSSSEARIEQAKRDWSERRGQADGPFPLVPGDEEDFIPLPLPSP
ncbi:MAG: pirin family protein, partial [Deltaproteobacteria bacterium]|nr:pirin family protein [Deltaproteobacteria bacterium]